MGVLGVGQAPLFFDEWFLFSHLRFSLLSNAQLVRQHNRGSVEYIVLNRLDGQVFRLSTEAYQFVGRLDGSRSVNDAWYEAMDILGDEVLSQREAANLLSQLYKAGLIRTSESPNHEVFEEESKQRRRKQILAKLKSPLAIKVPLFDPNRFLDKTHWIAALLLSPLFVTLFLLLLVTGLIQFITHFEEFQGATSTSLLSLENLLLISLLYPIVKALHEFGHAYFVKYWGGEVHEMGVMFLVFFPIPYVDASSSLSFSSKYPRMWVGLAGILVEMGITAVAMHLFVLADLGLVKSIAYNLILICGVSTLIFNGNPLLKFDAYYVLSDWWEEPNLQKVSQGQLGYLIKRYLLGILEAKGRSRSFGANTRLVVYSITSFLYRMSVMITIALWVATEYFIFGILMAAMSVFFGFLLPLWKFLVAPVKDSELRTHPVRTGFVYLGLFAAIVWGVGFWPAPQTVTLDGLVKPPEESIIRVELGGRLERYQRSPKRVNEGAELARVYSELLVENRSTLVDRLNTARLVTELSTNPNERRQARLTEAWIKAQLDEIDSRLSAGLIQANSAGRWIPLSNLLVGSYVAQGDLVGYLLRGQGGKIVTLIPEEQVEQIKNSRVKVSRLAELDQSYSVSLLTQSPASSRVVEDARFTVNGGGNIAVQQDAEGRSVATRAYITLDLELPFPIEFVDERVLVQLQLENEPLIYRWMRMLRRSFLTLFGV